MISYFSPTVLSVSTSLMTNSIVRMCSKKIPVETIIISVVFYATVQRMLSCEMLLVAWLYASGHLATKGNVWLMRSMWVQNRW